MVKVIDGLVIINIFTIILNIYDLINGSVNNWNIFALLCCSISLGGELIRERLKLKKIAEICNKVKEERGVSWDESF